MLKKTALKYLGYGKGEVPGEIDRLLDETILEIEKTAQPKAAAALFYLEQEIGRASCRERV